MTIFYFSAEQESIYKKKYVSVNSTGHDQILMQAFCNTCNDFHMEKLDNTGKLPHRNFILKPTERP